MGYVAVKGGDEAIENATQLTEFYRLKDNTSPITIKQLMAQFKRAIDKVMGEGSLYAPEYAAIALKQAEGDVLEAAFILRAFRATLSRNYYSEILNTRDMFVERRISSSFREIPGGQVLGPTVDYSQKLLNTKLANESEADIKKFVEAFKHEFKTEQLEKITTYGKVIDLLKSQGLLKVEKDKNSIVKDITREAIKFPAPRSARLQMLARAETGGLMALGYASMRGHGSVHPTIGELRVGKVNVHIKDYKDRKRYIGQIRVMEAEMISKASLKKKKGVPYFSLGYGLCFGQNETKAICMGILDKSMRDNGNSPTNDQEFVLYHTEGIEALGFTNHLKLPHYVTFQAGLSNLRQAIKRSEKNPPSTNNSNTRSQNNETSDEIY